MPCRRITLKAKEQVVWFVKTDDIEPQYVNAKIRQLTDWATNECPFGSRYDVIIIPSDTNKFSILRTAEEFGEDFQGDPKEWLDRVKNKLENCLTIHLSIKNDGE